VKKTGFKVRLSNATCSATLWAKIAGCIRARIAKSSSDAAFTAAAAADGVIEFYRSVLARHPENLHAKVSLAEGLIGAGRMDEAMRVLPPASELGALVGLHKLNAVDVASARLLKSAWL
jgi:thioredoxin-like negative regulator of GroEL